MTSLQPLKVVTGRLRGISMSVMVSSEFSLKAGKQKEFLNVLSGVLVETRAYDGCIRIESYSEDNGSSIILIEDWEI